MLLVQNPGMSELPPSTVKVKSKSEVPDLQCLSTTTAKEQTAPHQGAQPAEKESQNTSAQRLDPSVRRYQQSSRKDTGPWAEVCAGHSSHVVQTTAGGGYRGTCAA